VRCGPSKVSARGSAGALALALTLVLALSSCGGSGQAKQMPSAASTSAASLDGPTLVNPGPAPPLALRDYLGHPINISRYHGKAVLVTFVYTHCPDVCPTIVANLHNALGLLGLRASKVQIIGVSVDPRGDTRAAVAGFLSKHAMTGRMKYLVGTRSALTPVWHAWGISASTPDANEHVNHGAMVIGITASGRVVSIYPANFKPSEIAHDVPILASS
jgi:protein SCO1/2